MYLIDTNIFLEILLDKERRKECERFLIKVEKGKKVGLTFGDVLHYYVAKKFNLILVSLIKILIKQILEERNHSKLFSTIL